MTKGSGGSNRVGYSTEPVPNELSWSERIYWRWRARKVLRKYRPRYGEIKTFCVFLGSGRSGHSLVGSLLDAHRDAVIAHELDAFKYLNGGLSVDEIIALLILKDLSFTKHGRHWSGYDYLVPNQWQGRFGSLSVIGDKKGGRTTERLRENPELRDRLRRDLNAELRMVHVVRNPFDNIATLANRRREPLEAAFERYERKTSAISKMKSALGPSEIVDIRLEDLIANPSAVLIQLCNYLGLEPEESLIRDASSLVFSNPKRTRDSHDWTSAQRGMVDELIASHEFLEGYSFDLPDEGTASSGS